MKKTLIFSFISILVIVLIMLIGNIIIIGDKVASFFPFADILFYCLVSGLIFIFLVIPFLRVLASPEMPALDEESLDNLSDKELYNLGLLLAKNNSYIKSPVKRQDHSLELKDFFQRNYGEKDMTIQKIRSEIEHRLNLLNVYIRKEALVTFTITGLSQNGKFDFISLFVINFRLIKNVVKGSGFRPSYRQLIRVYYNVLAASLLTNLSEEILDDIDVTYVAEKIKLPGFVITSVIDGTFSALLTLRIGYITKNYIVKGSRYFDRSKARKYGFKQARKEIGTIVTKGKDIVLKAGAGIIKTTFGI